MSYQTRLEAMSDGELNMLLANLQYPEFVIYVQNDTIRVQDPEGDDFYVQYCNNPNDTMPLAFDAGMDFILNMDIYKYKCLASTFVWGTLKTILKQPTKIHFVRQLLFYY